MVRIGLKTGKTSIIFINNQMALGTEERHWLSQGMQKTTKDY